MTQAGEWTDAQIESYYLGVEHSDYPSVFWKRMEPTLAGCTTLIDIGCGPGAFALKALAAGMHVQAVDRSKKSLDALREKAGGSNNLKIICGSWPAVRVKKSDAAVCAYSFGGEIGTPEGIEKILALTGKVAFFIAPVEKTQTDFLSRELYAQAGLDPPSFSGTYRDLLRIFADLNREVEYETVTYDFGMPLKSRAEINRCAAYLSDKLGLPSPKLVEEHLRKIVTVRNGCCWVPNPRQSSIITWRRRA